MRNPGFTAAAILLASLLAGCGSTVDTGDSPTDPGDATLLVRSTPAGAAILVDGQPTGRVTPADVSTFAQTQESVVTLTLAGYHPWHGLARKVEEMTLTLMRRSPLIGRNRRHPAAIGPARSNRLS